MVKKDIANNIGTYSVVSRLESVRLLHENLLANVGAYLDSVSKKVNFAVFGIGPEFTPYTHHLEWSQRYLGNARVVALDYNPRVISACYQTLTQNSFFEKLGFNPVIMDMHGRIRPRCTYRPGFYYQAA